MHKLFLHKILRMMKFSFFFSFLHQKNKGKVRPSGCRKRRHIQTGKPRPHLLLTLFIRLSSLKVPFLPPYTLTKPRNKA